MVGVEGKLDATVAEIKALINGVTLQHNDFRSLMATRENGNHGGSILGLPVALNKEIQVNGGSGPNGRHVTKLEFPRIESERVEDWIFKVEQFFALDRIPEASKINVMSLHLDGYTLHWHKNFIKNKDKIVE